MNILALELAEHIAKANAANLEPAVRLNATSDIVWERKQFELYPETAAILGLPCRKNTTIPSIFPTTQFYDYTAIRGRNPGENYHLTFSLKEHNVNEALVEMQRGLNVAAVFSKGSVPPVFLARRVIDGDEHDYRPADPKGVIVGLKAKGTRGRDDLSGFVYRVKPAVNDDHFLSPDSLGERVGGGVL